MLRRGYKINLQAKTEVTYLLATGGHNAGIVSQPGHAGQRFRIYTQSTSEHYRDPEQFLTEAQRNDGSWWPQWIRWLRDRSGGLSAPPLVGAPQSGYPPLGSAPGIFVLQDTDRGTGSAATRMRIGIDDTDGGAGSSARLRIAARTK
jgi:polyhydroxyalkanoate synthase